MRLAIIVIFISWIPVFASALCVLLKADAVILTPVKDYTEGEERPCYYEDEA